MGNIHTIFVRNFGGFWYRGQQFVKQPEEASMSPSLPEPKALLPFITGRGLNSGQPIYGCLGSDLSKFSVIGMAAKDFSQVQICRNLVEVLVSIRQI